ncbi:unnamed protein product [Heligmosomoides polygyrus]|uniref:DUF4808 domain-containing protein n=1 Tax=Heligmosomoides polygyrus TaxID=6339 RepID=A0A183FTY9_HELPZ|nr:unnamed protein product [Heligmosomoides polygyrus]
MAIFLIVLFVYHFFIFLPRLKLKMYKVPQDEASKSLLKIAGITPDGLDKTQREERSLGRAEDTTQIEMDADDTPFPDTTVRIIAKADKKQANAHICAEG